MKTMLATIFFISTLAHGSITITPKEAQKLMKAESATLVDVREQNELQASGMAKGATWLPNSKIQKSSKQLKEFLAKNPAPRTLILYCRSGGRAGRLVPFFQKKGYQVHNMGGLSNWISEGLPTVKVD